MRVKITVFAPTPNAEEIRKVLGDSGAGELGEYSYCSFSVLGTGRFKPSANAKPHIGETGTLEAVEEERIEVVCERDKAKLVIQKMKEVHPYEEVAFDIVPLLEESEL